MILCPICLDLGFYPIFDIDGEQRYSIDCPDCGGAANGGRHEPLDLGLIGEGPSPTGSPKPSEPV